MDQDETELLAEAIKFHVNDDMEAAQTRSDWPEITRKALARAGIEVDDAQFDRAWRALRRSAFQGGSYVMDARRVRQAIAGEA